MDREHVTDGRIDGGERRLGWALRAVGVGALVAVALAGGYVWGERQASRRHVVAPAASGHSVRPPTVPSRPATEDAVEVTLTPDAIARAGIKTELVRGDAVTGSVSAPATVTSNAYRETKVHTLVGGILKDVTAELGRSVRAGQPLAVVFSHELADAQMKYLTARAMVAADHQKRERVTKLVEIGAASRQELEEIIAVHEVHDTEVAAARQRLLLLGLSPERVAGLRQASDVVSEVTVMAPGPGVVVSRTGNPGQVVNVGQELFVVADLSTVWVIADLYEKDVAAVQVGSEATVTVPHSRSPTARGRVTYIDPRVDPATRTAKVRVEVPNPSGAFRLGMFVNMAFAVPGRVRTAVVPRAAVQSIGDRSVVYIAASEDEGRFIERTVTLGVAAGDLVQVIDGLEVGERIVSDGAFFVRAEAAKTRAGG